jgi:alpha-beta hydrolase superfamily lysophospholipase
MVTEADIHLADGRTLHAYDTRADGIAGSPGASGSPVAVQGNEGYLEDTLASVQPWGFRPDAIPVPVLIMHGAKDKMVCRARTVNGSPPAARQPSFVSSRTRLTSPCSTARRRR